MALKSGAYRFDKRQKELKKQKKKREKLERKLQRRADVEVAPAEEAEGLEQREAESSTELDTAV